MLIPVNPATDWDFVTFESSPDLQDFIQLLEDSGVEYTYQGRDGEKGFRHKLRLLLMTKQTQEYMITSSTATVLKCCDDGINLLVKTDDTYAKYLTVFNQMSPEFYRKHIWKSSPENKEASKADRTEMISKIRDKIELLIEFV